MRFRQHIDNGRQFLAFLFGRFINTRRMASAAGLSYVSLLAIVPLFVVSIAILSAFPVFQNVIRDLQDFIFQNFVPDSRGQIREYLTAFASKASRLTVIGIVSMLITALLLMASIDRALNEIWHVRHQRKRLVGFLVYWAVLTLGPLLIGASLAITSYLFSLPLLTDAGIGGLKQSLLPLLPLVMESLAFTMMYWIVPNRPVMFRHAMAGGLLAALIFELAKKGFGFYLANFPTYEVIYGALAAIPVFLVWMYASWVIILFGGEFTYCLGAFRGTRVGEVSPSRNLVQAVRVLGYLWQAQQQGRMLSVGALNTSMQDISDEFLQDLLEQLEDAGIVHRDEAGNWILSRDTCDLSLGVLAEACHWAIPDKSGAWHETDCWTRQLAGVITELHGCMDRHLAISLHTLFVEAAAQDDGLANARGAE